jgi:murein L,D-transpeptidase YafK
VGVVSSLVAAALFIGGLVHGNGRPSDGAPMQVNAPRVVILKGQRTLHLFDGHVLVRTYPIDLGLQPTGEKRRSDDSRTPTGVFRVVSRNPLSAYHRFIGIDYPNEAAVAWGLTQGLLSPGEAESLRRTLASGLAPSWTTALGGGIGIHGRRRGTDWTGGCVAVSDEAVEELFDVLRHGDPIEILP